MVGAVDRARFDGWGTYSADMGDTPVSHHEDSCLGERWGSYTGVTENERLETLRPSEVWHLTLSIPVSATMFS